MRVKKILYFFIVFLFLCGSAFATCTENPSDSGNWYPDSGETDFANITVAEAAECMSETGFDDGDTIHLPAGTNSWTSQFSFSRTCTVQGDGNNSTIINSTTNTVFKLYGYDGAKVLDLRINYTGSPTGVIVIYGADNFVIGNVWFQRATATSNYAIYAQGHSSGKYEPTGLVYGCTFNNGGKVFVGATLGQQLDTDPHTADVEWADQTITLGSTRAVYIEDCTFDKASFGNVVDGQYGGSYVFRFNTVTSGYLEAHSAEGPLLTTSNRNRATRHWEIYGNTMSDTESSYVPMRIRGGTGVIFGNTISTDYSDDRIMFDNVRTSQEGYCNGSNAADGNEDEYGYPCRDQIGMGYDSSEWTSSNQYPAQTHEPAYLWSNNRVAGIYSASDANVIHQNRDFYEDSDSHMQVGPLASIPGTCTEDDGYWATDQGSWNTATAGMNGYGFGNGVLYVCGASNNWVASYTPYDYPHPLRDDIESSSPPTIHGTVSIVNGSLH